MSAPANPQVLAIDGGTPVRKALLPYGRPMVDDADARAVMEVLRGDYLTTGPRVAELEKAFATATGSAEAVAVSNGTAALHAAMFALGVGPGDDVLVPALTFAASANAAVYQGATPVFVDVSPDTLLVDPSSVAERISPRTRAVVAVDYAGQPCDYDALRAITAPRGLRIIDDACHALGGSAGGRPVGSLADLSTFSFHPVKVITTAEGGMITTDDAAMAARMRVFRNHGITTDHRQREQAGAFAYDMVELGYNYRLSDVQCALGLGQLRKLGGFVARRREIAARYDEAFKGHGYLTPLAVRPGVTHAYHIYVVRFALDRLRVDRAQLYKALRAEGIGVNVHYIPVHLHPYYRKRFGTGPGMCPVAEAAYQSMLTLPVFPGMSDADVGDVVTAIDKVTRAYAA